MVTVGNYLFCYLQSLLTQGTEREEGQGLVEYALIIVLVSIACIVMLRALGVQVGAVFTKITAALTSS